MKTQILHLEPHDDVISARDKMGWGQTPRILLVLPDSRRILERRLDLTLLQRHSQAQRAQLALVTSDPEVKFNARELGIPTFRNIEDAQTRRWRRMRRARRRPALTRSMDQNGLAGTRQRRRELKAEMHPRRESWEERPAVRLLSFALGAMAVFVLAGVLAPSAEMALPAEVDTQTITFTAESSLNITEFGITGALPAHELKLEVEGRDTLPTTGSRTVPGDAATGTIQLTNLTDQALTVPAGTVVLTLDEPIIRFETTRAARIAAGSGQQTNVTVRALTRGEVGNVPAGRLQAMEGALGLSVSVANPSPMRGGTDFVGPAASMSDRRQLHERLVDALQHTAAEEFRALLGPGDMMLTGTPRLESILEEVYEPGADAPADRLSLLLRLEFSSLVVRGPDLEQLAGALLDANLPPGFAAQPGTIKLAHVTAPILIGADTARWQVQAERQVVARISSGEAVYLSLGLPAEKAVERLESILPLSGPPEITVWPAWWPRLPVLPFRISIRSR